MKAKIRYLSYEIAKRFGSYKKREIIHLPDNSTYGQLLVFLEKRYRKITEQSRYEKNEKVLDSFIFLSDKGPLHRVRDKNIDPNDEILVAYADVGG